MLVKQSDRPLKPVSPNNSNDLGHNLVIISGCPRSGTTWLQHLLAEHPLIQTGQETNLFSVFVGPQLRAWRKYSDPKNWSGRGGVGLACYFEESDYLGILRNYMNQLLGPISGHLNPGELFLDKTPSHALYIPEIHELLPKCRLVFLLRDARDVVASILAASNSWGKTWAPKDARGASKMWVRYVDAVEEVFDTLAEEQFIALRYEDLHRDTSATVSEVMNFLDLNWDEIGIRQAVGNNSLEMTRQGGGVTITVGGEVAKISGPLAREPQDFVRRGRPGGWREDLTMGDKLEVWRVAHKTMAKVGYRWDYPW